MLQARQRQTSRLNIHYLESGTPGRPLVILLHGNVSSSAFYQPLMQQLPDDFHYIAPDMRGYGDSEALPVDATRGVRDFSDDLKSLIDEVTDAHVSIHLTGWSLGGGVVMQYAMDYPARVSSITLLSPMSPFGFGGTRNTGLTMEGCDPDFAGSGGGAVSPNFIDCLRTRDGELPSTQPEALRCNPQSHARATMNGLYFKMANGQTLLQQGRIDQATEDLFTEAMFKMTIHEGCYPGNFTPSMHWPGMAPGDRGFNNAISPKYCDLSGFADAALQVPVLWIRGADDAIVSEASLVDINNLGKMGIIPGWPGAETHPPQPMIRQMRSVLDAYQQNGGSYTEVVFEDCGHSPHIEYPEKFIQQALELWRR